MRITIVYNVASQCSDDAYIVHGNATRPNVIVTDERPLNAKYSFPRDTYKEFRKILFESGLTAQEFFFFVVYLVVLNDNRVMFMLDEAKKLKSEGKFQALKTLVRTSTASIYHIINERSKFK